MSHEQQANPAIKNAVRALALAAPGGVCAPGTLSDAEAAIPDDHAVTFDTTVRVFGTLIKRDGFVQVHAVSRVERENIEQPTPLVDGEKVGLRLVRPPVLENHDDCQAR